MEPGALSAGSVALIGFGADSAIEVLSAVALLWRLRTACGALLMLPVILWQGWETLDEAREGADDD
jgi:hypothetical protein